MKNLSPELSKGLIILTALFTSSLVTANLLGSKLVQVGSITVSVGLFIFPFTFIVSDIITEVFGKETASRVVLTGIAIQIYVLLFVYFGALLPASPRHDISEAYTQMFMLTPRMVLASITAYTVSQLLDIRLFLFCRKLTEGKHLWLRTNFSTWLSQALDTIIFISIFLGGVLPLPDLLKTALTSYLCKLVVATFDTPFVYLGVYWLKKITKNENLTQKVA